MLKQRIITGITLAALAFFSIMLLPPPWFAFCSLVVIVGIGGWEWTRLVGIKTMRVRMLYLASLLLLAAASYLLNDYSWPIMLVLGVAWWLIVLILTAVYEPETTLYKQHVWVRYVAGFLTLVVSWWFIQKLHLINPVWVIYLVFLIAVADIFAYFTGRAVGQHKLAPHLSPGKTLEGAAGGLAVAAIYAFSAASLTMIEAKDMPFFILLSLVVVMLSIVGDLFESMLKREMKLKDSGTILPGHGGILDRIDSLVAALPIFTIGLAWGQLQGVI